MSIDYQYAGFWNESPGSTGLSQMAVDRRAAFSRWKGGIPASCIEELRNRGHEIDIVDDMTVYGRGQMICRNQEGVLMGATEPRADGTVAAWLNKVYENVSIRMGGV